MKLSKTKLLATLGPASSDADTISKLIREGVDSFRVVDFHYEKEKLYQLVEVIRDVDEHVPLSIELSSVVPQVKNTSNMRDFQSGLEIILTTNKESIAGNKALEIDKAFNLELQQNSEIFLGSSGIKLKVLEFRSTEEVLVEVINPGEVFMGDLLLTNQDYDLNFNPNIFSKVSKVAETIQFVIVPFITNLNYLKALSNFAKIKDLKVMLTVGDYQSLRNISQVINHIDAINIDRGRLSTIFPAHEVSSLHKSIIYNMRNEGIPALTMSTFIQSNNIETLRENEIFNISSCVLDSVDGLTLDRDTSVSKNPIQNSKKIDEMLANVENLLNPAVISTDKDIPVKYKELNNSVKDLQKAEIDTVILYTDDLEALRELSRHRIKQNVLLVTSQHKIAGFAKLMWGIKPFFSRNMDMDLEEVINIFYRNSFLDLHSKVIVAKDNGENFQLDEAKVEDYI